MTTRRLAQKVVVEVLAGSPKSSEDISSCVNRVQRLLDARLSAEDALYVLGVFVIGTALGILMTIVSLRF